MEFGFNPAGALTALSSTIIVGGRDSLALWDLQSTRCRSYTYRPIITSECCVAEGDTEEIEFHTPGWLRSYVRNNGIFSSIVNAFYLVLASMR